MTELHELSLCEAQHRLGSGEISSVELTEHTLARIEALDPTLHAFATPTPELARRQARDADAARAAGRDSAVLGVPIAIKDLCATEGAPTHAGTKACAHWHPPKTKSGAGNESTVARRLREAGAVLVGKLTTTEGASGIHHPAVTAPINPWNAGYWTGASSSGSGAATAAGLCFASLGSDTGGSIRFPSQCCGLVGIKATWGRVSRYGVFPLAPSLDHVGPMARHVEDAAAVLAVIAGRDEADPSTFFDAERPAEDAAPDALQGLRVGIDEAYCREGVAPPIATAIEQAMEIWRARGLELVPIQVPRRSETIPAWLTICAVEAAASHAPFYPERAEAYGPALAALLEYGRRQTPEAWLQAQLDRVAVTRDWDRLFSDVDLVVSPATFDLPPTLETGRTQMRGEGMRRLIAFTAPADLCGFPTLSLPAGQSDTGVPYGFQVMGRSRGEAALVGAGAAWQEDGGWAATMPPAAHPVAT